MQIVLNGQSYRPADYLTASAVWHLVERLEAFGWRRVSATSSTVSLTKG